MSDGLLLQLGAVRMLLGRHSRCDQAVASCGINFRAFSRSIALRSSALKIAASPVTCSSLVR